MANIASHNWRVLIVDDDKEIRSLLVDSFTQWVYHCVAADHGEAALRYVERDQFHLVNTDYQMPTMDGIPLLEALTQRRTPSQPIILLSGNMSEDIQRRACELGAYAVYLKPFASQELVDLSARAIESHEIDRSGSARGGATDGINHASNTQCPCTRR